MTTRNEATEAIYQRFVDNFTGVTLDRIAFENEEFSKPATGDWVRLWVRNSARIQDTLGRAGNRRFRSSALVSIQVYTETNTGVKQGQTLATEAADIFEGVSFSGLDFQAALVRKAGPEGRWDLTLVETEFDYDEIK